MKTKTLDFVFPGHFKKLISWAVTNDNRFAVTSGEDNTVRIWNLREKNEIAVIEEFFGRIGCVIVTRFKNAMLFGIENLVVLKNIFMDEKTQVFKGHKSSVVSVGFTYNLNYIISADNEFTFRVWRINSK